MIEDMKAGIKLAGGVVDLAKSIKDLSEKSDNLALKDAAAELRSQTIDLKETVNDMRNRIMELEKQLAFNKQLIWNGKCFEYEKDGIKTYICNGCHADKKFTHMSEIRNKRGYHGAECPVCKNSIKFQSGEPVRLTGY